MNLNHSFYKGSVASRTQTAAIEVRHENFKKFLENTEEQYEWRINPFTGKGAIAHHTRLD